MTKDKTKKRFDVQEVRDEAIEAIDERIELIDKKMKPYVALNEMKQQLLSARRALLGGNRTTGAGGTRVTLDDVVGFVKDKPGSAPNEIAERFGVSQTTIGSHLYRNKDRFIKKEGRYWIRDPKNGMNTEADIEEDDE